MKKELEEKAGTLLNDMVTRQVMDSFQLEFQRNLMFGDRLLLCKVCNAGSTEGIVESVCKPCREKAIDFAIKKVNLKFVE